MRALEQLEEVVRCVAELGSAAEGLAGLAGRAARLAEDLASTARAAASAARSRGLAAPRLKPSEPRSALLDLAAAASSCSPLRGGGPALVWSLLLVVGPELGALEAGLGPDAERLLFDVLGLREVGSVRSQGREVAAYGLDFPDWRAVAKVVDLGDLGRLPWAPDPARPGVEAAPLCRAASPRALASALALTASTVRASGRADPGLRDLLLDSYGAIVGRPSIGCDEARSVAARLRPLAGRAAAPVEAVVEEACASTDADCAQIMEAISNVGLPLPSSLGGLLARAMLRAAQLVDALGLGGRVRVLGCDPASAGYLSCAGRGSYSLARVADRPGSPLLEALRRAGDLRRCSLPMAWGGAVVLWPAPLCGPA